MLRYARPHRGGLISPLFVATGTPSRTSMRCPKRAGALALVRESPAEPYGAEPAAALGAADPVAELEPALSLASPDPADEADALSDLGDEIATLAAHIHSAEQRFLLLIADFDRRRGWELDGHRSCAHWLCYRTGIDLGACREKVRTARVLEGLPETSAAMARGALSFSAVRALSRVATPENEQDLLALATDCTISQLERTVRAWKRFSRLEEDELERARHEERCFSVFPDDDGMYVVKGRLPAEVGVVLMRALEAASDVLYRENPTCVGLGDAERRKRAAQRRADGVALLAERALGAGFGGGFEGGADEDDSTPISGSRAERYQVVLHVDAETLRCDAECDGSHLRDRTHVSAETSRSDLEDRTHVSAETSPSRLEDNKHVSPEASRSHLEDGTRVSAETSRRRSCDSGLVTMTHGPDGSILDVGRKTRTISPALRRALDFRDHGCRFPGCGLRFTDGHHIRHWADGGATSLANCLLLCGHHHRLLHEGGWQVTWWGEGHPVFFDPRGGTHFDGRWKPSALPERPIDVMINANSGDSVPTATTAGARWKSEADIPDQVYFRALEAID